jgi:dGTPase
MTPTGESKGARSPWISVEAREAVILAPLAARSTDARRERASDESPLRSEYQRDRDRIIHTKSFRRLMHKTQVFIGPTGDHVRTRLTHTLEVTQIARTIGRALGLNEDLIEAIGMGHDLGHTPFGHAGERALGTVVPGFRHNEQSLRIVDKLEKDGEGLNLTDLVRDGILRHSKTRENIVGHVSGVPSSLEGQVMKIADGVAYLNHDLDDAIRAGVIQESDIPVRVVEALGKRHASRIDRIVTDIVTVSNSMSLPGTVRMSQEMEGLANELRDFLFERVYDLVNRLPVTTHASEVVVALYSYFVEHPDHLPRSVIEAAPVDRIERQVADYVASMTDRFALELYDRISIPQVLSP